MITHGQVVAFQEALALRIPVDAPTGFAAWTNALGETIPDTADLTEVQRANIFNSIQRSRASVPRSPLQDAPFLLNFLTLAVQNRGELNQVPLTLDWFDGRELVSAPFGHVEVVRASRVLDPAQGPFPTHAPDDAPSP